MVRRRPYPTDDEPKKRKRKHIVVEEPTPDTTPQKATRTDLFQERTQSTLQNVGTGLTYGGVIGGILGCFGGALGGIPGCLAGASVGAQVGMAVGGGIGAAAGVIGGTVEQLTYDEKNPESAKKWGDTTENVVGIAAAVGAAKPSGKKIIRKVDQRLGVTRPTKPLRIDTSSKTLFAGPSELYSPTSSASASRSTASSASRLTTPPGSRSTASSASGSASASPTQRSMQARLDALKPLEKQIYQRKLKITRRGDFPDIEAVKPKVDLLPYPTRPKIPSPTATEQKVMNIFGGKAKRGTTKRGTSLTQRFIGTAKKKSPNPTTKAPTPTNIDTSSPFTEIHLTPVKEPTTSNNPFTNDTRSLMDFINEQKSSSKPTSPKQVDSVLKRMFGGLVSSKEGAPNQNQPISPISTTPPNKSGWSKTKQQTYTFFHRVYNSKRKFKSWPTVRKFLDKVSFGTFGKGLDAGTIVMEDFAWMYNEFQGAGIPEPPPIPGKATTRGGKTIKFKGTRHPDWVNVTPPDPLLNKTKGGWQAIDRQQQRAMRARYWREHPSNIALPAPVPGELVDMPKAPNPFPLNQPAPQTRPRTTNTGTEIKKIARRGLRKAPKDIETLDQQTSERRVQDARIPWFQERPPNPHPLNQPVPEGGNRPPTLRRAIQSNRGGRRLTKAPKDITTLDRYTSQKAQKAARKDYFRERPPPLPSTTEKTPLAKTLAKKPIKLKKSKRVRITRETLDKLNTLDEQNWQRDKEGWSLVHRTPMETEPIKPPPPVKPNPEIEMQDLPPPKPNLSTSTAPVVSNSRTRKIPLPEEDILISDKVDKRKSENTTTQQKRHRRAKTEPPKTRPSDIKTKELMDSLKQTDTVKNPEQKTAKINNISKDIMEAMQKNQITWSDQQDLIRSMNARLKKAAKDFIKK